MEEILIDDQDRHFLAEYSWYIVKGRNTLYVRAHRRGAGRAKVYLHRLITGAKVGVQVDHINGNGLDNKRSNLRLCSQTENLRNSKNRKHSKQPYRGIRKSGKNWYATITFDGKRQYLGTFKTGAEAASAYVQAALLYHREFAVLNFQKQKKAK